MAEIYQKRPMTPTTIDAYRMIETSQMGFDHAIELQKELRSFSKLNESEKEEVQRTAPYVNKSRTFPDTLGNTYYKLKVEIITTLQTFQVKCAYNVIEPHEELARIMQLIATIDTMKVQGSRFYLPVLLGNAPHPKPPVQYKEKSKCILELCEYIRIRTGDAEISNQLEVRLDTQLSSRVIYGNINGILQSIVDIYSSMRPINSNYLSSVIHITEEYMYLSFGKWRVY
jgi:hypothetical protein